MAFFSGTDTSTLQSEGNDTNCFVSLIVDTAGTYKAAITRKVKTKKEVTTRDLGSSYELFGEGARPLSNDNDSKVETIEDTVIEYFMLDVERHEVANPLAFLDERFEQIEHSKVENSKKEPVTTSALTFNPSHDSKLYSLQHPWESRLHGVSNSPSEGDLFGDYADLFKDYTTTVAPSPEEWAPDSDMIHEAVCRMVACSLILNVQKFDLRQWVVRHMGKMYERIFQGDDSLVDQWVDYITDFMVYSFNDPSAPDAMDDDMYYNAIIAAMRKELQPLKELNPYITFYDNQLLTMLV